MQDISDEFAALVDKIVQTILPLDLQKKLLSTAPLTKEDAEKYLSAVQLVAQAKSMHDHSSIHDKLDKAISKLDSLHTRTKKLDSKLDLTLYEASGQNPAFKPNGNGSLSPVNRKMVEIAVDEYLKNGDLSVRSICSNVMSRFKEVPGAYDDLNTFRRQVARTIKILGQKPR